MSATVLIVEDEPQIQELVAVNLEHSGHKVLRAASAEEAEASIRHALPDVLVRDWMLPGEAGPAVARGPGGGRTPPRAVRCPTRGCSTACRPESRPSRPPGPCARTSAGATCRS